MEVRNTSRGVINSRNDLINELQCLLCVNHGCAEQKLLLLLFLLPSFLFWKETQQNRASVEEKISVCVFTWHTDFTDVRPGSTTGCGGPAAPLSSCSSAFSMAWLKEFWKLGTGTRSEPSLSPSLSAAGGASSLSAGAKHNEWLQEASREFNRNTEQQKTGSTGNTELLLFHPHEAPTATRTEKQQLNRPFNKQNAVSVSVCLLLQGVVSDPSEKILSYVRINRETLIYQPGNTAISQYSPNEKTFTDESLTFM